MIFGKISCDNPKEAEVETDVQVVNPNLRKLGILELLHDLKHNDVIHIHEDFQFGSGTRRVSKNFDVEGKKIIGDYPYSTFNLTYKTGDDLKFLSKCKNFEIHHVHFRILAKSSAVLKGSLIDKLKKSVLNDVLIEFVNDVKIEDSVGILAKLIEDSILINVRILFKNMVFPITNRETQGIISGRVEVSLKQMRYMNGVYLKGNKLTIEKGEYKRSDDDDDDDDDDDNDIAFTVFGLLFGSIKEYDDFREIDNDSVFNDKKIYLSNSFVNISELNINEIKVEYFIAGGLIGAIYSNNLLINKCFVYINNIKMIEPVIVFGYIIGASDSNLTINSTWSEMNFDVLNMNENEYIGIVGSVRKSFALFINNSYFVISLPNSQKSLTKEIGYITGTMYDDFTLYLYNDYVYIKSNNNKQLEIKAFGDLVGNIKHLSIKKYYVISNNSNIIIHKYKNILNPSNYEEFKKNNDLVAFEYSNERKLLINKNIISNNNNINSFIPNSNILIISNLDIYENNINVIDCESDLFLQSKIMFKSINETKSLSIKQVPSKVLDISDNININNEWYNLEFKLYELEINNTNNIEFSVIITSGNNDINIKVNFILSCSNNHKPLYRNFIKPTDAITVKPTKTVINKPTESVTVKPTESTDPIPKYSGLKQFIIFVSGILLLVVILYCLYRRANSDEEKEYVPVVQDPEEAEHFLDPSNN